MSTESADPSGPSDAELIRLVRGGSTKAYAQLYKRHVKAAYNLARQLAGSATEADDLVSEAFTKILDVLRAGRGPDAAFRAYLLTALRHTAYDRSKRERRVELTDDVSTVADTEAISVPFQDSALAGLERSMVARAFATLPERWQAVLWHTEVENEPPVEVAPLFGLTPNGVAALAYRAREGLRQAYLQMHLAEITTERCRATVGRLGAWARGGLSRRDTAQVEAHLDECPRCRRLADEVRDTNDHLRVVVAPLVLGATAIAYLGGTGVAGGGAAAGTATGVGGSGLVGAGTAARANRTAGGLPRQAVTLLGSAAALVVVLVLGLIAGDEQTDPQAASPPAPAAPEPTNAPPGQQQPLPSVPPGATVRPPLPSRSGQPGQVPSGPDQSQSPGTQSPGTQSPGIQPPGTQSPGATPPASPPGRPDQQPQPGAVTLAAAAPTTPMALSAGGSATELRIPVTNTGAAASAPVSVALDLPAGVRVEPKRNRFAGWSELPRIPGTDPEPRATPELRCASATCATSSGLRPGETVDFVFPLVADQTARSGRVSGRISAGNTVQARVEVRVEVSQPVDDLSLTAERVPSNQCPRWPKWWPYWTVWSQVDVTVTNTGDTSGEVLLNVSVPAPNVLFSPSARLAGTRLSMRQALAAGRSFRISLCALTGWQQRDVVHVTATLGKASDSADVTPGSRPRPVPLELVPAARATPTDGTTPAPANGDPVQSTPSPTGWTPAPSSPAPASSTDPGPSQSRPSTPGSTDADQDHTDPAPAPSGPAPVDAGSTTEQARPSSAPGPNPGQPNPAPGPAPGVPPIGSWPPFSPPGGWVVPAVSFR
ncbi:sigma-70 family RNA polymerase sigma factor [Goodfellowiella coeruleoviolacea]|uniref:RNA polymerase sigma factor, sigma-70 family n=1 Tax=Goodfellowiella coeruleoviolacea TaxID=334858 RepID=A0AAE3GLZ0_9PSEU|nr:sigma-70 family RNA polymerase sigma factor [Goodfellowiella coeruleoviolacea]MCP2169998.1 RNA polymerase sigma factor, sigma-70 family [Goodfellowiella coeruleoviolacea]